MSYENSKPSRLERKKEEMKHKILDVAMQLFKSNGIDATTMELIAKKVDIAKGTLYNYFPIKEAILDEYIKRSFTLSNDERVINIKNATGTRSRMKLIFAELLNGVRTQKEIFERYIAYNMRKMVSFQQNENMKSGISLLAKVIIEAGQESGEIRTDLPPAILEDLFVFAFIEAVKQYYFDPAGFDADKTIEKCIDVFINGVKAPHSMFQ